MPTESSSVIVPLDLPLLTPDGDRLQVGEVARPSADGGPVGPLLRLPALPGVADQSGPGRRDPGRQGVGAVAVGGSADYQAIWLREEKGVQMPLLLDPEHRSREHVGADKPPGRRMADPRGAAAYRTLAHGFRPQTVTRDTALAAVARLD